MQRNTAARSFLGKEHWSRRPSVSIFPTVVPEVDPAVRWQVGK